MNKRIVYIFSVSTLLLLHPINLRAEVAVTEVAKIVTELGISVIEEVSTNSGLTVPASTLSSDQRAQKIEASLAKYTNLRNEYTTTKSTTNTLAAVADSVISTSAMTGNVAGVVVGAVLRGGIELGNQTLDKYAQGKSRDYLIGISEQLIKESGVADFDALIKNPKIIEETLVNSSELLNDVRKRAQEADDPALLLTVAASVAQVADAKAVVAYKLAQTATSISDDNSITIADIDKDFSSFVNTMDVSFKAANKRLDDHEQRLVGLEADVGELEDSVENMQLQVGQLGKNQDLILDFVSARMTPSERINALKNSEALVKRIQCPAGAPLCDKKVVRDAMINRYTKEVEIQKTIKDIGGFINDANTSLKIANDLGLDVPKELTTAVKIANVGFSVFTNFTPPSNYLGAISSITGLFSKQRDIGAERHKQMMGFLKANFEQVNTRLEGLRKGQERIIGAVAQVSEQIHAFHVDMDARFRVLNFRFDQIDRQLRQLTWAPWLSCNTVSNFARSLSNDLSFSLVDQQTLFFSSFQSRVTTLNANQSAVRSCMHIMRDGLGAITTVDGWKRFGAFIDLERVLLDLTPEQTNRIERAIRNEGAIDYRDLLSKYLNSIVKPSSDIVINWSKKRGLDQGTLLYLLAATPETSQDLNTLLNVVFPKDESAQSGWRFKCNASDFRYRLIGGAVCRRIGERDALIGAHLKSSLDTETLIKVSEWAVITSQVFDLYDGATDKFARSIAKVYDIRSGGAGKQLILTLAPLMTLGVAYENRLNGALTARIIADDIKAGATGINHNRILNANPYLAENVAMLLLKDSWKQSKTGVSMENRHAQAVLHSRSGKVYPFGPFKALYGDSKTFKLDPYGRPAMVISVGGSDVALPLPGPKQLQEGRFIMPVEYSNLITARERVVERAIDYEIGADKELVNTLIATH